MVIRYLKALLRAANSNWRTVECQRKCRAIFIVRQNNEMKCAVYRCDERIHGTAFIEGVRDGIRETKQKQKRVGRMVNNNRNNNIEKCRNEDRKKEKKETKEKQSYRKITRPTQSLCNISSLWLLTNVTADSTVCLTTPFHLRTEKPIERETKTAFSWIAGQPASYV